MLLEFRKSSYSTGGENCVEVADLPTGAAIRDSKHPELGFLPVEAAEWVSFARLVTSPTRVLRETRR
ncbi:DUF397 domain-containing protein [Nocardiopsis sp. EMB25]|uniref:DUF397 domain-containing protein n=1 Tax=Nocardiopsis sp. EMB25 TaxID=2835867 RepID=UPI002284B06D|nr:DUF397 domain-containing protein [Nocardiopsis sp. EMB25]MCY9785538.1 DUF397 domain-containing protein [Nocardiopsis sp. EMB25]